MIAGSEIFAVNEIAACVEDEDDEHKMTTTRRKREIDLFILFHLEK